MSAFTRRAATAGLAVLGPLSLAMLAASPRVDGAVVYACAKNGAAIHLVAKKSRCNKGEARFELSTKGPRGVTGATGPIGATGPAGAAGLPGATGKPGVTGPGRIVPAVTIGRDRTSIPGRAEGATGPPRPYHRHD